MILAGGLATRMLPHTAERPKFLLPVAGEPFAAHQLRWLAAQGVGDVVIAIGHLGQLIEDYVGDGSAFGLDVTYSSDGPQRLGTGGALRAAIVRRGLQGPVAVMYGDSYLSLDIGDVVRRYRQTGMPALMVVYENHRELDVSNVAFDGRLVRYEKGVRHEAASGFDHIDYGLSIFDATMITARIPPERSADLSELQTALSREGLLAGYLVAERFYEIGSPLGLAELEQHLARA